MVSDNNCMDHRLKRIKTTQHDLRNLHLDLDDDLYFFEGKTMVEYICKWPFLHYVRVF